MHLRIFCGVLLLLPALAAQAYDVSRIAPELKANARAVVRNYTQALVIRSASDATLTTQLAVTVLSAEGEPYAAYRQFYDAYRELKSISARVFDGSGALVREIKAAEFSDRALISEGSFTDARLKSFVPSAARYPYTIEYSVELHYRTLLSMPAWSPAADRYVSVEHARFSVSAPPSFGIRYQESGVQPVQTSSDGAGMRYVWQVDALRVGPEEPYSPPGREVLPQVLLAPLSFRFDAYEGSMQSWRSFGEWIYGLNQNRGELPPEAVAEVQALVAGISDPLERARRVYAYMQARTRYVSIQFGIGGYQPAPAAEVHRLGYGDCKGLANYTRALMEAAAVPAVYTLVHAGGDPGDRREVDPAFPGNHFNHIILCLPLPADTVWLECTSQQMPFGFLGDFTDNRHVLLITGQGGKLVRTPAYTPAENYRHSYAEVALRPDGGGTASIRTRYGGLQFDGLQGLLRLDGDDQRKAMLERIRIPSAQLSRYAFARPESGAPAVEEQIGLELAKYASLTGSRMFITLNLWNRMTNPLPKQPERKRDILLDFCWLDTDTVVYQLPPGYRIEALPKAVSVENAFGAYAAEYVPGEGQVTYIRSMRRHAGRFPADQYPAFADLYQQAIAADRAALVLVREP
ncbi:MAG: DUF3857 domain-containing protein [Bacteroidia bacterium]|nr:DUF3857 domain-containing protein [Bacteroidia bacterium]